MRETKFERIVDITPAFDKRDPDPHRNYGIHGCDLVMNLKGKMGVVYFSLSTNWQLPHVTKEMKTRPVYVPIDIDVRFLPSPIELGYHSPVPLREKMEPTIMNCDHLEGRPCYCESGCLAAEPVFEILLTEGSNGVWRFLEEYYRKTFKDVEDDI